MEGGPRSKIHKPVRPSWKEQTSARTRAVEKPQWGGYPLGYGAYDEKTTGSRLEITRMKVGVPVREQVQIRDQADLHWGTTVQNHEEPSPTDIEKRKRDLKQEALQSSFSDALSHRPWPMNTLPREVAEKIWGHSKERPA